MHSWQVDTSFRYLLLTSFSTDIMTSDHSSHIHTSVFLVVV